ncbi:MAG: adenylate/guanylate cyclase domain-containing protein [Acidimicrobiia bacterium]|nr:adenylate/guanylate cyclase domain-containing protein [Acidimicrobiia bacterium]
MINERHMVEVREPGRLPVRLLIEDRLPFGRACEGYLLTDTKASRAHLELRPLSTGLEVRDLGSSNGTRVNGATVTAPVPLGPGDRIEVGDTRIVVAPTLTADEDADAIERAVDATVVVKRDELQAALVGSTITIVFSDIVDSTALNDLLGDRAWVQLLARHDSILRAQLDRYEGREVKGQGDGFLMTFPSARHGLVFAIAVQRELDAVRSGTHDFPVRVRMGVHTGEVVHQGGDLFGRHVNLAARVAALGGADEVLVSQLAYDLAAPMGDLVWDPHRVEDLKGIGSQSVHPLRWREGPGHHGSATR